MLRRALYIGILNLLLVSFFIVGCTERTPSRSVIDEPSKNEILTPEVTPGGLVMRGTYEDGKLYKAGEINVVVLNGSYYEMGRQYGTLLKTELNDFYKATWEGIPKQTQDDITMLIDEMSFGYSARHMEMLGGMAETSGLTITQLMVLDQLLSVSFLKMACSFIAVWEPYTQDGTLIAGRNFDWPQKFNAWSRYLTVTVYNPVSGGNACATFNYVGMINGLTGINEKGLLIEMNNGTDSMGNQIFLSRTNYLNNMLSFLWDAGNLKTMGKLIETTRPQSPVIINIADEKQAYSFETAPFDTRRRDPNQPGLLVATNYYMLPSWGILNRPAESQPGERYDNLLKLAGANKGKIDVNIMKSILDTALNDGGATLVPDKIAPTNPDWTLYQVIAIPSQMKVWVKTPNYPAFPNSNWVAIDLNPLFKK
jgi:hypothetical protein